MCVCECGVQCAIVSETTASVRGRWDAHDTVSGRRLKSERSERHGGGCLCQRRRPSVGPPCRWRPPLFVPTPLRQSDLRPPIDVRVDVALAGQWLSRDRPRSDLTPSEKRRGHNVCGVVLLLLLLLPACVCACCCYFLFFSILFYRKHTPTSTPPQRYNLTAGTHCPTVITAAILSPIKYVCDKCWQHYVGIYNIILFINIYIVLYKKKSNNDENDVCSRILI